MHSKSSKKDRVIAQMYDHQYGAVFKLDMDKLSELFVLANDAKRDKAPGLIAFVTVFDEPEDANLGYVTFKVAHKSPEDTLADEMDKGLHETKVKRGYLRERDEGDDGSDWG